MRNAKRPPYATTVDKALALMAALGNERRELGVSELSRLMAMNSSTVYRLLRALERHKFVQQDSTSQKYKLGIRLIELGEAFLQTTEVRMLARPGMVHLMELSRETVHLMVLDGDMGVYIDRVEGRQRVRVASSIGQREHLHCSAVGKAMLAYLAESRRQEIIRSSGLPRLAQNTIVDSHALERHLRQIRQVGYAIDNEEAEDGVRCIGAPIFDHTQEVVAAISISGPAYRTSIETLKRFVNPLRQASRRVSLALGANDRLWTSGHPARLASS